MTVEEIVTEVSRDLGLSEELIDNAKLWARAIRIVRALSGLDEPTARRLIEKAGGRAKVALVMHHAGVNAVRAKELLVKHKGSLRAIVGDLGATEDAPPDDGAQ